MERERAKWRTHKALSTDAERRGGPEHSSDEVPVMGVERRFRIIQLLKQVTTIVGGTYGKGKILRIRVIYESNLGLKLYPKKIYLQHYSKGVKYLGVVIQPHQGQFLPGYRKAKPDSWRPQSD